MSLDSFTPSFFKRLQQLKIHTRRAFLGSRQGGHVSARRGHGLEFADFRLYAPGDDFRHIDWNSYGRTDRLYVRQFREEQDLNVMFLIDASASMAFPPEGNKFGLASNLALALGYVALTDGDSVTFSLLGQKNSPRYVGPKALHRASVFLDSAKPDGSFSLPTEIGAALQKHRIPGKCFLISDCLYPLEEMISALRLLSAKNFEVAILQVLSPAELQLSMGQGTFLALDAENGKTVELTLDASSKKEYAKALADHIESLEKYAAKNSMQHILISSSEDITDLVLKRLPELGLLK